MISIVIPLYNEEQNVRPLLEALLPVLDGLDDTWEVICVNDGSSDGTGTALSEAAAREKRLKVINFRRNYGQTAAMMAGIAAASGDTVVTLDGDLQNDPRDIPHLLEKLDEGYDLVSGWRKDRKDAPILRILPSRIANWIISRASGVTLHDYGCTLKASRREVIRDVKLYGEMHRFIPIYANWLGARVTEIPVRHHPRRHGVSKYGLERVVKVILDLMVVLFLGNYNTKPIYVFGIAGLVSIAISFLAGVWALALKFTGFADLIETPLPLLIVFAFVLGVMFIMLGLIAELLVRVYYESQDKQIYVIKDRLNFD